MRSGDTPHGPVKEMNEHQNKLFDSAHAFIRHFDETIEKSINTYFAIAALVGPALIFVLDHNEVRDTTKSLQIISKPIFVVAAVVIFVGVVGWPTTLSIARIRAIQLSQLRLVQEITHSWKSAELESDPALPLPEETLLDSYQSLGWIRMAPIFLISSFYFSFGVYLLVSKGWELMTLGQIHASWLGVESLILHIVLYRSWMGPCGVLHWDIAEPAKKLCRRTVEGILTAVRCRFET
jgi:hypothetical protein